MQGEPAGMRCGFTTGTCAALAAGAAAELLLTGRTPERASVTTPGGMVIATPVLDAARTDGEASCSVRKDAGDDPDATDGILVRATVRKKDSAGVTIRAGDGVGRVTRPGLDQPVGEAAINRVPRRMIEEAVASVCLRHGYAGGIEVTAGIPGGEAVAAKTFNPRLGIVGGLSIIGTTGIVEPMSTRARVDSMRAEMKMLRAEGAEALIITPGKYGESFLRSLPRLFRLPWVTCANFIGEAVDIAAEMEFTAIVAVGHIGKIIKLAGGIFDTHSRNADCRLDLLALHAALCGVTGAPLRELLDAATTDDGLDRLGVMRREVVDSLLARIDLHLRLRAGDGPRVGSATFSNRFGLLGISPGAAALLAALGGENG